MHTWVVSFFENGLILVLFAGFSVNFKCFYAAT